MFDYPTCTAYQIENDAHKKCEVEMWKKSEVEMWKKSEVEETCRKNESSEKKQIQKPFFKWKIMMAWNEKLFAQICSRVCVVSAAWNMESDDILFSSRFGICVRQTRAKPFELQKTTRSDTLSNSLTNLTYTLWYTLPCRVHRLILWILFKYYY